ncbi:MAG: hypothetical protein WCP24_01510 [bacterium]
MITFVVFIISLALLVLLFVIKSLEIFYGRKMFLERQFESFDAWISKILLKIKYWWSHVNFRNIKLISSWIIASIRKSAMVIKSRFDHKQSHFFAKRDHDIFKNKGSVSFFLKNVSDYKKSLNEGNENRRKDN